VCRERHRCAVAEAEMRRMKWIVVREEQVLLYVLKWCEVKLRVGMANSHR
jgi:hypothetical protein